MDSRLQLAQQYVAWVSPAQEKQEMRRLFNQLCTQVGAISQHPKGSRILGQLMRLLLRPEALLDRLIRRMPSRHAQDMIRVTDWAGWAEECEIPHIPVEEGPEISLAEIEATYEALPSGNPAKLPDNIVSTVVPWIIEQEAKGHMWRFDLCAPETIKAVLGCIRPKEYLKVERIHIPFSIDPRVLHILWDSKQQSVKLVSRPWINGEFHAGFPVEFRVFRLRDDFGGGFAACNYYVQRALPQAYSAAMERAVEMTRLFEERARQLTLDGNAPRHLTPFPAGYSVDWLLLPSGELTLVEGGPAFPNGSHPCCFNLQGLQAGRRLLASEPGAQYYCPPQVQTAVDLVKALQVLDQAGVQEISLVHGIPLKNLLVFAAIQGDRRAQDILSGIEKKS